MSSFRLIFCDVADTLRALTGPAVFDVRPTNVTIRTRTYVGGRRSSQSAYTDSDLVLPDIYKVSPLKFNEVTASGGRYEVGDLKLGPVTPRGVTKGWTEDQLAPKTTSDGVEVIYVLSTSPDGAGHSGEYSRVQYLREKSFSHYLILRRRSNVPL